MLFRFLLIFSGFPLTIILLLFVYFAPFNCQIFTCTHFVIVELNHTPTINNTKQIAVVILPFFFCSSFFCSPFTREKKKHTFVFYGVKDAAVMMLMIIRCVRWGDGETDNNRMKSNKSLFLSNMKMCFLFSSSRVFIFCYFIIKLRKKTLNGKEKREWKITFCTHLLLLLLRRAIKFWYTSLI